MRSMDTALNHSRASTVVEAQLREHGFYNFENSFDKLIASALKAAREAGSGKEGAISKDASQIPLLREMPRIAIPKIVIDMGGSHTRVGVSIPGRDGEAPSFKIICDIPYEKKQDREAVVRAMQAAKPGAHSLAQFGSYLAQKILTAGAVKPGSIGGLAIIWSNAMTSHLLNTPDLRGVGGKVVDREIAYRKNEPFIADLKNGDNLSEILLTAFREQGIPPLSFVIGNDTIFTATALPDVDGGMIGSTGSNATIISDGIICNTECGAKFQIPASYMLAFFPPQDKIPLEALMSGNAMYLRFEETLLGLAGCEYIAPVAQLLFGRQHGAEVKFQPEHLSLLDTQNYQEFMSSALASATDIRGISVEALATVAKAVAYRGGFMAAAMMVIAVGNQDAREKPFMIGLDSSQARYLPSWKRGLDEGLKRLPGDLQINYTLLEPQEGVSPPMIGAVNALGLYM